MNRKNTILIAVLINAGLLAVLLIAALTTQEETMPAPALIGDASSQFSKLEENPLFGDSMDLAMRKSSESTTESPIPIPLPDLIKSSEAIPTAQLAMPNMSAAAPAIKEDPIVHKIPSLAAESNPSLALQSPSVPAASPTLVNKAASAFSEVAVKKGDNLEKIAKNYHTTVDEIIKINQLPSSFLRIGQVLKIPAERNLAASGISAAPLPKAKAVQTTQSVKSVEAKAPESAAPEYYTVKVGDNPWTIAMKHHMKIEELLRLNGLNEEKARKLKPGDRLRTR